ncbi:MAG: aspartyl protease family protein, partial [Thermoanaerobaculia bacterium]
MSVRILAVSASIALTLTGCALYNDVVISNLIVSPAGIERGSDLQSMLRKADYLRAVEMMPVIDARPNKSANDLALLGSAELAAGRYDAARRHLRAALDLMPFRTTYANIAWDLAQVEYMSNNFESSLDWAQVAVAHGLNIKQWHLDYLAALTNIPIYNSVGLPSDTIAMRASRPDVPRIDVRVNRSKPVNAVIDSGAVLSIVSQRLATDLQLRKINRLPGTFYGLLGEPISVDFAVVDSLELGDIVIENIPVAIMPDEKMRFLVNEKREFRMDFLLGANLLKEFRTDLDFARGEVTFTKLTAADRHPDKNQNLFIEGFRPMVRCTVNRKGWFMFVLDTGSEVTFLNESQLSAMPINMFTPRVHSATLQGLGGAKKHGSKIENVEI